MKENKIPVFDFPKLELWDKGKTALRVVNSVDSNVSELLSKLGICTKDADGKMTKSHPLASGMSIADKDEIKSRQEIFAHMMKSKSFANFCKDKMHTDLPAEDNEMIELYKKQGQRLAFFKKLENLENALCSIPNTLGLPEKLQKLLEFIKKSKADYQVAEQMLTEKTQAELLKSTQLFGRCTIALPLEYRRDVSRFHVSGGFINQSSKSNECYGLKKFSRHELNEQNLVSLSDHMKNGPMGLSFWVIKVLLLVGCFIYPAFFLKSLLWSVVGLLPTLYVFGRNFFIHINKNEALIVKDLPRSVTSDIKKYFDHNIKDVLGNVLKRPEFGSLGHQVGHEEHRNCIELNFEVAFAYVKNILSIRVIKIYISNYDPTNSKEGKIDYLLIPQDSLIYCNETKARIFALAEEDKYNSIEFDILKSKIKKLSDDISENTFFAPMQVLFMNFMVENFEKLFKNKFLPIASTSTDDEFAYFSLSTLYGMSEIKPYYETVKNYRDYFDKVFRDLNQMYSLLTLVSKKSNEWNLPIEFPTILNDDQHVIGFNTIYPVHLIGRKKLDGRELLAREIVPINSLPPLNGQIIGLSGANSGGKTTVANVIADLIYFAQTGLPVFGRGVHLNVKSMIGLIFDEGSKGDSKARKLLEKSKIVFEELEKTNKNNTVIIIDELGGGAQTADGIQVGCGVLKYLKKIGVSVIYNTHLTEIANYCETNLGGINFKIDRKHQISSGVGKGELMELARELSMDKYFSS